MVRPKATTCRTSSPTINRNESPSRQKHHPRPDRYFTDTQGFEPGNATPDRGSFATSFDVNPVMTEHRNVIAEDRALPEFSANTLEFSGPSSTEYMFEAVNGNLRA